MTRARTPGSLSTTTASVCVSAAFLAVVEEIGRGRLVCAVMMFMLLHLDPYTSTLPSSPIAASISASGTSSPSSISLCALPDGIIGKQLARLATRQSKITGRSTLIISLMAASSSAGFSARMPTAP